MLRTQFICKIVKDYNVLSHNSPCLSTVQGIWHDNGLKELHVIDKIKALGIRCWPVRVAGRQAWYGVS